MSGYSVSYWTAHKSALDAGPSFFIQDIAQNIQAALASLTLDSYITSIVVSDGPANEVSISVSQITGAAAALARLKNPDGTTASVIVSDTAANIGANFAAIGADSQVSSVQVSNNAAVTLTGSQVGHNLSAIAKLINANSSAASVIVKDTAANLATYLNYIETIVGSVSSIVVSNNSQIALTASQVAADATALAKVRWSNGSTTRLFKVSDTAAHIGADLDALAANANITTITISDSAAVQTTLAQITSDAAALGKLANASGPGYSLAVTDTATNLSAALDTLGSLGHLASIVVSDSAALTVAVAQIANDAAALGVTTNQGGGAYSLIVADTAANIGAALSSLNANSHVANIEVLSGTVALSSVAALTTYATALGKLHQSNGSTQAQVVVTDTAADVTNAFTTLHNDSQISKIIVSDSASNQVQFGINQLTLFDTDVLDELYQADGVTLASVTVSDAASNLTRGALGEIATYGQVDKIIVLSATGTPYMSVAQWQADTAPLAELFNPDGTQASISIQDSGDAIEPSLASLNADAQVASIVVTSGVVDVDVATADSVSGLAKLQNSDGTAASVTVSDTASAISGALDALNGNFRVGAIVISDGNPLTLSASQVGADATALGKIQGSYTIAVSDLAANVAAGLDQLTSNGHVTSIALTDLGTPTLTLSQSTFLADAATVGSISGDFELSVTGVAYNQFSNVAHAFLDLANGGNLTYAIAINDTGANLTDAALTVLGGAAYVASIAVVSGTLSLTEAQFAADLAGLAKITGPWSVAVTGATVAQVSTIESDFAALGNAGSGTLSIGVSDTAAHLTSAALTTLGADSQVASIAVSSGTLSLTEAQFVSNLAGLAKITGAWSVDVTGVTVAQVSTVENDFSGLGNTFNGSVSIGVTDTAANLTGSALASLGFDSSVHSITVSGAVQVSYADFNSFNTRLGLAKITGAWTLDVTGVAVPALSIDESQFFQLPNSGSGTLQFSISATATDLDSSALTELGGDALVTAIVLSSGTLALGEAAFVSAPVLAGLAKMSGSWSVYVSGVTTAEVSTVEAAFSGLGNAGSGSLSIAVSDGATNLTSAALVALGADAHVQSIVLLSGTLTLTQTQFNASADQLGLAKIPSYTVNLTGVAAADAANLAATAHVGTLAVSDTASNVQDNLDALNGNASVTSITISDNAALAMSAYSATHDSRAIGLLQNANSSLVSLTVSDTAANIASYFDQLNGESNISSIVISDDNPLNLSAAQIGDASTIAKLSNADSSGVVINIADTAAHISANLAALESDIDNLGYVSGLTISDNGAITVSLAELTIDQTALGLLQNANGNPVSLIVEDTAENILDNAVSLAQNAEVTEVLISDNAALQLTVASYQSDAALFAKLGNANASPFAVDIADNAASVSGELDTLAADAHVQLITVQGDGAIGVDIAQITSDAAALAKTYNATDSGASTYTLNVTDTALNIQVHFDALNANARVTGIVVSDSAQQIVTLSAQSALSDTTAEGELYQADGSTPENVRVEDVASAISTDFNALNSASHVATIAVADPSNAVTISAAQFSADNAAIGKMQGSYDLSVSGTGSAIAARLDALEANGHVGAITVTDNAPITVTISQLGSDATVIGEIENADQSAPRVIVADTAANIDADIGALAQNTRVGKIVVTDSATNEVSISASQAASASTALSELYDADGSTLANVKAPDNASDISANFASLNAETAVNEIIVTDSALFNTVTLSAAVAVASSRAEGDLYQADGVTPAQIEVSDNGADLAANLDALNSNLHIASITITDPDNALSLLASQVAEDATALGEITPSFTITVADSSADVAEYLDALQDNSSIQSITLNDDGAIDVSDATFERDQTVIASLTRADASPALVTIVDNTANVSADLVNLADASAEIAGVTLIDSGTIDISSIGAFNADASILSKISGHFTLAVADSAASITGVALDALEPFAVAGHLASLTVDGGGDLVVTVAQITSDQNVLAVTANGGGSPYTLEVADTAAHIAAALDALEQNGHIDTISVSDPGTPMTITAAQYANDSGALAKINSGYNLEVTGVAAANAVTTALAPHVTGVTVADSAQNVVDNLDGLAGVGLSIYGVTLTDATTPTLAVSYAQLTSDAGILGEIHSAFNLDVTGVLASQTSDAYSLYVNLANPQATLVGIAISDSSAAVQANFDTLDQLGPLINHVAFTDDSPALTLTSAQYDQSGSLREAIGNPYDLTVTGVAAGAATAIASDPDFVAMSILDSSSAVQANIGELNSLANAITTVTFTDQTPALTMSESQYHGSATLRGEFQGLYRLTVTGVLASDVSSLLSDPHVGTLTISDNSTNIQSQLATLDNSLEAIETVRFTDSSPALTLTYNQYAVSENLIAIFQGQYSLTVTGVTAAEAITLGANSNVSGLTIADTSSNVQNNYAALIALGAKISSVGFIDVSPMLSLTGSQYDGSSALRAAFQGSYLLTVTAASAGDAATFAADAHVSHVAISDSSAAVQTNFAALNANASKISSVTFTDASPTLSLTETQYNASSTLRAAFVGAYTLTETNVLVADLQTVVAEPNVTQLGIADTSSHVTSSLVQLNLFASEIVSIAFTDNSPSLTLSEGQYVGYGAVRAKFQGSYTLTVTGALAADAAGIAADSHVAQIQITDTSADVQSCYSALTTLGATIGSVTFTGGSPTLSLTEAQYNASATLRAAFQGSYGLTVTGVAAADVAGVAADSHVSSLSIADFAANIQANIGVLESHASEISAITLSDAQTPTLTLTAAQYAADQSALQKIASPFNLTLTGVAADAVASTVTAVGADANVHTLAIDVSDTASNISAALNALDASVVQSVTITDNAALVFSASAAAAGASALAKFVNANASPLSLAVSDTGAQISANFSALAGIDDLTAITISDNGALSLTGAQVLAGAAALSETLNANSFAPTINVADTASGLEATGVLDALEANVDIGAIVVSGGPLVVTVQQLVADSDAIADMTNASNATLAVTVRDTANNIAASLGLLALDPQVTAIQVSSGGAITLSVAQLNAYLPALSELQGATLTIKDTAAAVQGALDQLQGLGATVGGVVVSNNLAMTLSATKVANDSGTLAKLSNRSGAPISFNVSDSAANVMTNLSALAARNAQIGSITLTSGIVSVSAATYQADYATLDKIVGGFSLSDAAASVASLFDQVSADTHVHAITLTDNVTPVLNLSPSSASADATAFAEITNPLFEILTSQGGTYYASGTGPNNAQLVVTDNNVHANEKTATNLEVVGSADVIAAAANATLALSGNGMTVTAGTGDSLTLLAGTGDLITGSNDGLTISGNMAMTLSGSADTIAIGANDTLTLAGPQTLSAAVSGAGALAVTSGTLTIASGTTLAMAALSESGAATISALGDLTYAGALSEGASATLTEASGHTLTLNGTSTLSGTVAGAGALAISGGAATVAGTTHLSTTTMSVQGASTVLNVTGAVTRTSNFSVFGGATVDVSGGNLSLYGTGNSLSSMSVVGAYTLANYGALSVNSVTVGGSAVLWNNANVTQSSTGVVLGDSSASAARIMNQAAGVWNIVDDSGVAAAGASVKVANSGLFEKTGGTGTSAIAATFNSTGAVLVNTGTLAFSGAGDTFGSSISGAGGVSIAGGSATIANGASLSVATFSETGSSTQMSIGAITYGGAFTIGAGASISVLSGATLTLDGSSNLAGTMGGSGSFAIDGGTATLSATSKLWGAAWSVQGSSTMLNVAGASGRVGDFSVSGGATVNLSGGSFNLSGTGNSLANGTILGSNTFANSGTLGVGAVTIGGSAVLSNAATLDQAGGTVTLGDSSVSAAKLTNATGAIYDITDNSGVASASTAARFNNAGLLEKTGGTGVSLIAPVFSNTGTITVSAGTLEFAAGYTGAGADTISGASTLAFDAAVGSGATIAFTGSGGDLKLANPHAFAGVISGFDTAGANDAVTLLGSWTSAGFTENSGHTQGVLQLTSGTQTASLAFSGNHANSFHLTANAGSTIVTYG